KDGVDRKYACLKNQHDEMMSTLVLVPGCSDSWIISSMYNGRL
ncbi:hypothetical protein Tco_0609303, partial [Tanacetum coccineum]